MDALALVLVFLGLMALAFTYAATRPRPPSEFELAVRRISASIEAQRPTHQLSGLMWQLIVNACRTTCM